MKPAAYYNEIDSGTAEWIRELIKDGLITDGEVDERSIEDVLPADVRRFDRCHFFAGIAVWDYALGLANWPKDRKVWTGSCPCQPFSAAGKREGFDDERHLWPAWFHLISECQPDTLFGEQVASKDGLTWLDLVHSDMEGIGYRIGTVDLPVAGVGAPHRRQRFWFVADPDGGESRGRRRETRREGQEIRIRTRSDIEHGGITSNLAVAPTLGRRGRSNGDQARDGGEVQTEGRSGSGGMDNTSKSRCDDEGQHRGRQPLLTPRSIKSSTNGVALGDASGTGLQGNQSELLQGRDRVMLAERGPTNGFWHDAEWIYCRDEKYRPTKPGIFPLVNGATGRVGLLRGAGNAISPWAAKAFIEAYVESTRND